VVLCPDVAPCICSRVDCGDLLQRSFIHYRAERKASSAIISTPRSGRNDVWKTDTINRSIEEERRVQVLVRDNNVDQALKVLKKRMQREGIFREMKLRSHYEKPSERKTREKAEAIRRARKLARKKMQREGLLPMKPRVVPGAAGRGFPARSPRL
jgi:small subunit ribosomal protein S21